VTSRTVVTSDIDLFSDETLYDPYPAYAELRDLGAAVYLTATDAYAIPRYADLRAALRDWELFASSEGVGLNPQMNEMLKPTIICAVGEAHDTMRGLLSASLSPRAIRNLGTTVREKADALVDELVDRGRFDAVADLAYPFPVGVIMDMIGFPPDHAADIARWSDAAFQATGPANDRCLAGFSALEDMFDYLVTLSEDDFLPGQLGRAMCESAERGNLPHGDVIPMLWNFTGPAMDTTTSVLGHAIWRFSRSPEQWTALRADRSLIPSATLEVIRMDSPIQVFARRLSRTTTLDDVELPAGAKAIMMYGSANRDGRHYRNPDEFDITRNPVDHLGFGYGLHACVGQGLARMEIHSMLAALADRVEVFDVDDPDTVARPKRHLNNLIRSIESLPVSVVPA
jgi:cytochrome P450